MTNKINVSDCCTFGYRLRRSMSSLALVAALGAAPVLATESEVGSELSESALTAEVKARLMADELTRGININVDSNDGQVRLRGTVPSEAAREKAEEIVLSVDGAATVSNDLVVGDSSSNPQTATAKAKEAGEEAGQSISDGWITAKVKTTLLADDDIAGLDIDVSTQNGEVSLAGEVPSRAHWEKAVRMAFGVEGVMKVDAEALVVKEAETEDQRSD